MDGQELKELLKKNLETSERSLEILKKLHKQLVIQRVLHTIKWVVIIVLLVWGFVALQPFVDQISQTINDINQLIPGKQ